MIAQARLRQATAPMSVRYDAVYVFKPGMSFREKLEFIRDRFGSRLEQGPSALTRY